MIRRVGLPHTARTPGKGQGKLKVEIPVPSRPLGPSFIPLAFESIRA
jgi:hypothetical protein